MCSNVCSQAEYFALKEQMQASEAAVGGDTAQATAAQGSAWGGSACSFAASSATFALGRPSDGVWGSAKGYADEEPRVVQAGAAAAAAACATAAAVPGELACSKLELQLRQQLKASEAAAAAATQVRDVGLLVVQW